MKTKETRRQNCYHINAAIARRLKVHAMLTGDSMGKILEKLVKAHIPDYQITPKPANGEAKKEEG